MIKLKNILKMCILALFLAALFTPPLQATVRTFFPFDNGLTDIKDYTEQAALLQKLGYDGICTRPGNYSPEFAATMDQHGIQITASYVVLNPLTSIPDQIKEHLQQLKGRNTLIWLAINHPNAKDATAVAHIQQICKLAKKNGLRVVLYPHVGFKTDTVATCLRLRELADRPELQISFNLCHFLRQNDPAQLEATLQTASPHLGIVQINGANRMPFIPPKAKGKAAWVEFIKPLGEGDLDVTRILSLLDEYEYKGPVNLQCYGITKPSHEHLSQSMKTWKSLNP